MKPNASKGVAVSVCVAAVVAGALTLNTQTSQGQPLGASVAVVEDWSHRHLIFSAPSSAAQSAKLQKEPRFLQQVLRRNAAALRGPDSISSISPPLEVSQASTQAARRARRKKKSLHRDWNQSLGTGGTVGAEMFPAKASFSTGGSPNCANATTPDYVVFNTNLAGSTTQASIIAFDNLYATTCSGTVPLTYWAYNTGGTARTSAALSLDGTQVAFVQSVGTTANLVLLKWRASPVTHATSGLRSFGSATITFTSGTIVAADVGARISGVGVQPGATITAVTADTATMSALATATDGTNVTVSAETVAAPGVAPSVTPANYRSCTAPCMTSIAFSGSPDDTNSSPFPDYSGDIIYVGANNGTLHKFTGVFAGTPAEAGSPWPVTVHSATVLSSPVLDFGSNKIFVGDASGQASFVTTAGALGGTTLQVGAAGSVIVDGPIVDSSTGKVFWFASFSQPFSISPFSFASLTDYVVQTDTSLGSAVSITQANSGSLFTTRTGNMHTGAFDNVYFSNSVDQGSLYFCAISTANANRPALYRVGFDNAGVMSGAVSNAALNMVSADATNQECSPVTEFLNGSTDRIFVSVTANGGVTGAACTGACLYSFAPASRTVTNAVTSGTTTVTSATANFVVADQGSAVSGTNIPIGATIVTRNSATSITISAAATGSASGGTLNILESFPTNASAGLPATGGTSGIIIDNSSGSTGASQVYFSPLGGGNGAVQASQAGLN